MFTKLSGWFLGAALFCLSYPLHQAMATAVPHTIEFRGESITTAVAGEPFVMKFKVTNVGDQTYPYLMFRFTFDSRLEHTKVSPANANFEDDMVWWQNVPIAPGKTFNPELTVRIKPGTPVGTKVWLETEAITFEPGSSFAEKGFPITVVASRPAVAPSPKLSAKDIPALFKLIYGRNPSTAERKYWEGRLKDKPLKEAMKGAMAFQKAKGKSPKVLGTRSYDFLAQQDFQGKDTRSPAGVRARVTVLPTESIKPGDDVRFSIRVFNDNATAASGINMSFIPDTKVAEFVAAKPLVDFSTEYRKTGGKWEASGWKNLTIPAKSSRDFSITYRVSPSQAPNTDLKFTAWLAQDDYQIDRYFSVPIAGGKGKQDKVNTNPVDNYFRVAMGRFPTTTERTYWTTQYQKFLTNTALGGYREDRVALFIKEVSKKKGKPATTSSSESTAALKITAKNFNITSPDSLNTDRADQTISWDVSDDVKNSYPKAKIELCQGKDFKSCVNLEAVVENDGSQIINMPPVPRIGKWYLHIIGRDSESKIHPSVSAARLVTLHQ